MKEFVIKIGYGGLGDHLLYSPIPRILKQEYKYDKVYISNFSIYRNDNIKKLVWEKNPFIDGFINKDGPVPNFSDIKNDKNILDAVIEFLGFKDCRERYINPEIYYIPKKNKLLDNKNLYDPNYINSLIQPSSDDIERYIKISNIIIDYQMKEIHKNSSLCNISKIESVDLEEYCDFIFSCKNFYCLTSGSATLASAIRKDFFVFYKTGMKKMFHHAKKDNYILV